MARKRPKQDRSMNFLGSIFVGAVLGFVIGFSGQSYVKQILGGINFLQIILLLAWFYVCLYLSIVLHEAGHMVCAFLSGYRFVSFRIGKTTFFKRNGKIHIGRYYIPGTAGQCFMMPNTQLGEVYPYRLYLLGGVLVNAILGVISLVLVLLLPNGFHTALLWVSVFINLSNTLINLMPVKGISSDGDSIRALNKSEKSRLNFWRSLAIYEKTVQNVPIAEIPVDYFDSEPLQEGDNTLAVAAKISYCAYLMALEQYEQAITRYEEFLNMKTLISVYRCEVTTNLLLLKIVIKGEKYEDNPLITKELKQYWKAMKKAQMPSHIALQIAVAKQAKNLDALQKAEKAWQICKEYYPQQSDFALYEHVLSYKIPVEQSFKL